MRDTSKGAAPGGQALLADGTRRLQLALLPAAGVSLLLAINRSPPSLFVALLLTAATVVLGHGGIERVREPARIGLGACTWGRVGLVIPWLDLLVLLFFLVRSRDGLKVDRQAEAERALERARQRTARREARAAPKEQTAEVDPPTPVRPAAAAVPATRTPLECAAAALPSIKAVGLSPDAPLDTVEMRIADGSGIQLPPDSQPALWVTPDGFLLVYLVDEGEHFRYLTRSELRKAGMSAADLHRTSLRNLAAMAQSDKPGLKMGKQDGFHGLLMGGHFEASLVLLDALWTKSFQEQAPNGAVVAIPARDICAFCDARASQAIGQLRTMAKRVVATGDHVITDKLFVRRDGRWHELKEGESASDDDLPPLDFTP